MPVALVYRLPLCGESPGASRSRGSEPPGPDSAEPAALSGHPVILAGPAWSARSASGVLWAHIQAGPGLFDLMLPMGRRIPADFGRLVIRRGARAEMGDLKGGVCT